MAARQVEMQEKFAFGSKDKDGVTRQFGPFDTKEAANKSAKALAAVGVTVEDVTTIWTVASSKVLANKLRSGSTEPAKDVSQTKDVTPKSGTRGRARRG